MKSLSAVIILTLLFIVVSPYAHSSLTLAGDNSVTYTAGTTSVSSSYQCSSTSSMLVAFGYSSTGGTSTLNGWTLRATSSN